MLWKCGKVGARTPLKPFPAGAAPKGDRKAKGFRLGPALEACAREAAMAGGPMKTEEGGGPKKLAYE
jgi:hypothetical protein